MSVPTQLLESLASAQSPDSTDKSVAEAVQAFCDGATNSSTEESIGDYLWNACSSIFDVVGRTPAERQGGLLELMSRLRQTTVSDKDGQPLNYGGGVVWEDLPLFGWVARDRWNLDGLRASATAQEQSIWENWTAFLAQLTGLANVDDRRDLFNYSLFALWSLRAALEDKPSEAVNNAFAITAASIWIRYAGAVLRKLSAEGRTLDGNMGAPGGKFADRDWKGFNEERWTAWKEGFEAAQGDGEAADKAARDAAKLMEDL